MMIKGMHGMFYSDEAAELRAFLRDKLQLPATDAGEGWLIFDLPSANMGVHPTDHPGAPASGTHAISFYCDDIEQTVADLQARGVEFMGAITDQGWGRVTRFEMPGGVMVQLYQPTHP
jgi:predicted enzyme related to lactoylglutathione lyase